MCAWSERLWDIYLFALWISSFSTWKNIGMRTMCNPTTMMAVVVQILVMSIASNGFIWIYMIKISCKRFMKVEMLNIIPQVFPFCISNADDLGPWHDKTHRCRLFLSGSIKNTIITKVRANNFQRCDHNCLPTKKRNRKPNWSIRKKWKVKLIVNAKRLSGREKILKPLSRKITLSYQICLRFFCADAEKWVEKSTLFEWLHMKADWRSADTIRLHYYSFDVAIRIFCKQIIEMPF